MSEVTELIELPPKETAMQVFMDNTKLDEILNKVRDQVVGTVYDMSKRKDREACASDAYKVARSKTAMEKLGAAVSAELKDLPKKVDAGRRYLKDGLEAIQDQVREPLTKWEEAEEARIAYHKHELAMLESFAECGDLDAAMIRGNIETVEDVAIDESWEEFEAEAHRAKAKTLEIMRAALVAREKYESEQAELARLRAEAEERRKQDEADRIAREAAERATREAEAKAQAEREAAAQREAEAKAAAERAERERLEAIERQKQAEARAEAERLAAEERAKLAAEEARQAEIKRQADAKAAEEAEQRRREADKAHKTKIMGEAKRAFMSMNLSEEIARAIVLKIVRGEIPNISIKF